MNAQPSIWRVTRIIKGTINAPGTLSYLTQTDEELLICGWSLVFRAPSGTAFGLITIDTDEIVCTFEGGPATGVAPFFASWQDPIPVDPLETLAVEFFGAVGDVCGTVVWGYRSVPANTYRRR